MGDAIAISKYGTLKGGINANLTISNKKQMARLSEPFVAIVSCQLVYQLIVLRAETRKRYAIAVAALGNYLINLNLWSRIAQKYLFHNLQHFIISLFCLLFCILSCSVYCADITARLTLCSCRGECVITREICCVVIY